MFPFTVRNGRLEIDEARERLNMEAYMTTTAHCQGVRVKARPVVAAEKYESPVGVDFDPAFNRQRIG